jgi:hypothetical protein
MSSVIEFPGKEPPPEGYSKEHVDKLHAKAFRDLEGVVCDLERMGQIAQDLIVQCVARGRRARAGVVHLCCHAAGEDAAELQRPILQSLAR